MSFDNTDDVFVHFFDLNAMPISSPAALANDIVLDPMPRQQQQTARIAATSSGWVGVWETIERTARDFDLEAIARTDLDGPAGETVVTVNPTSMTLNQNRRDAAVALGAGRVVWVFQDETSRTIRYATTMHTRPLAMPAMDALLVSGGMAGTDALQPRVVATSNGFVATWSAGAIGSRDIYALTLNPNGAPMGSPIVVNEQRGDDQDQPAIAASGDDVVIAWRDLSRTGEDTDGSTIRWRRFNATLAQPGSEHVAPSIIAGDQSNPTVAIGRSGAVLIAWQDANGQIRGRNFRVTGEVAVNRINATNGDFEVNRTAGTSGAGGGPRVLPSAAFGGASRFVVTWEDQNSDGAGAAGIRLRTFRDD